ncbi:M67 family metallopeptidase [Paenibacillus wulumuqiensis]|uniref:M67 family metallopeptidase n=1 Tax=Paenibacillus wulumuqiensis TaxID=1567107 RepID=UPI0006967F44|nr:M67 family metallopeptidase [Paenibacillus wulumuqiensis]
MTDLLSREENKIIHLASTALRQIEAHMVSSPVAEVCGVLLGKKAAGGMHIHSYRRLRNVAPDPLHHFSFAPEEWIPYCWDSELIGIFHSHPFTSPVPSVTDREQLPAFASMISVYLIGSSVPGSGIDYEPVQTTERITEKIALAPSQPFSTSHAHLVNQSAVNGIHSLCDISSLTSLYIGAYKIGKYLSSPPNSADTPQPDLYMLEPALLQID